MSDDLSDLDALLGQDASEFSLIDPKIVESGEGIAKSFLDSGVEAWGTLLGRGVMYTEGSMQYRPPAEDFESVEGIYVVTKVAMSGDRTGSIYVVLPELGVKGVVAYFLALAMGTEADVDATEIDEEAIDAYSEAINNMLGAASQTLKQELGLGTVKLVAESTKSVNLSENSIAEETSNEELLCHQGSLTIEGMEPVEIRLLMEVSVTGMEASITQREDQEGGQVDVAGISSQLAAVEGGGDEFMQQIAIRLKVPVVVELATKKVRMQVLQELSPGSIIEFRKQSHELLDICAGEDGDVHFAQGEVVIINEHFGIQVRKLIDIKAAIAASLA